MRQYTVPQNTHVVSRLVGRPFGPRRMGVVHMEHDRNYRRNEQDQHHHQLASHLI